jgi:alkylhydroperoxidase/carboxymuconolactone decarboxylase family protein YurZ
VDTPRITELKQKYGAAIIENGLKHRPDTFIEEVDWRDKVDQHYTRLWLEFTYGGLFARKRLDDRTRFLVSLTQFLCLAEYEEFEREIDSALKAGAKPREVLEVVLQSTVYIGYLRASRGAKLCLKVFEKLGRMDEITNAQLPLAGRTPERSLDQEKVEWPAAPSEEDAKLREYFMAKYGWESMSSRIRLQSHQPFGSMNSYDRVDPHYLKLWLDFIYGGMYPRGIVDDRTRLLVMVGICLALNEPVQLANHIKGAMLLGAKASEVLEVVVHSTAYCGMPTTVLVGQQVEKIAKELGRGAELLQCA